jgi:acyl-CoA reductase-like NAD-dependent aldehyde dehydrogenase
MSIALALNSYIGGDVKRQAGAMLELRRPASGAVGAHLIDSGEAVVTEAVENADRAFRANRRSTLHMRSRWLRSMASAIAGASEELASIVCEDVGKPIRACRFETNRGAEFLEGCAAAVLQLAGEMVPLDAAPAGAGHIGFTRHIPYGVVGAITPFNAPINLLVQKVGPALAAGNAVVAKPAPAGTRAALRLAELFVEAGLPSGLFNVVTGDREAAGHLVQHPLVRAVTFTGGTAAGDQLARIAGSKKFVSELGSNAANIVLADADLADASTKIAAAAFEASGQQCISAQRVLVHRAVYEEFTAKFKTAATRLKVGPAEAPDTDIGPMVHAAAAERVMAMAADAAGQGARIILEPRREGCTISPGIFADVPRNARLWREEVFGPLALVMPFDDIDQAVALANDSPFGLQGAVFTRDIAAAMQFSEQFDVGSLWINEASRFRLDMYPFGGVKSSGVGREGIRYAIEELSQLKFTGIKF